MKNLEDGDIVIRRNNNGWTLINVDGLDGFTTTTVYQDPDPEIYGEAASEADSLSELLKVGLAHYYCENNEAAGIDFVVRCMEEPGDFEYKEIDDDDDDTCCGACE